MKGLELSRKFYNEFGEPMLKSGFGEILPHLAVGLVGSGSECYGFDDDISKDHDFEAGFCIFIPDEDIIDSRTEFALERAYTKLPKEYMGYKKANLAPVGSKRRGVIRISDFLKEKIGKADGNLSLYDWLFVPEYALAEVVNGEIFLDLSGSFTEIRNNLKNMPEDARLKRLAGNLLLMGQAGQYNYNRSVARKDTAAAQLSAFEFVKAAMQVIFLLNREYMPYYKWSFRALGCLPVLSEMGEHLEYLISSGNAELESSKKYQIIEEICNSIINELKNQGLTSFLGDQMEGHAYAVNNMIKDPNVRNMHILCSV